MKRGIYVSIICHESLKGEAPAKAQGKLLSELTMKWNEKGRSVPETIKQKGTVRWENSR